MQNLWRGSLLPFGCAAVVNPADVFYLKHRDCCFWGRFATQWEQAPSPQVLRSTRTQTRLSPYTLPTIPVSASVDKMFALRCTPYRSTPTAVCTKINQPNSSFFQAFFVDKVILEPSPGEYLPPKSVGGSVDKMFAIRCSPSKQLCSEI